MKGKHVADIIKAVRADLKANADEATRASFQRFFKEEAKCYGVKTGTVTKMARQHWAYVKTLEKEEIFALCEKLYASGYTEEAFVANTWLPRLAGQFQPSDFKVFQRWIETYIDNWAKCDSFCNHTMGDFIQAFPEYIARLKQWTASPNRWLRRAAAVSLIVPAKRGEFLEQIFEIADLLLEDPDDLVQKGYGWMLKESSRIHQAEVFDYVVARRQVMPRTALRYAIELMPKELKAEAMRKDR